MFIGHEVKTVTIGSSEFVRLEDYEILFKKYKALKNQKKQYEEAVLKDGEERKQ